LSALPTGREASATITIATLRSVKSDSMRSNAVKELVELLCLTLLFAGSALVILFPEGGLGSAEDTLVRAGIVVAAATGAALALSFPLRMLGLIRWSPPYGLYVRQRDRRRGAREAQQLERRERQSAPYRVIQSISD
jgi:hypothetical protein